MGQAEKMQELKDHPQQQKMLDEVFLATNEAIKKEFPVYAKLVQADVSNAIMGAAMKDGQISAEIANLYTTLNELMMQVGKDLEKHMMSEFKALKDGMSK